MKVKWERQTFLVILFVLAAGASQGFFWWERLGNEDTISSLSDDLSARDEELALKNKLVEELSGQLAMTAEELTDTENRLRSEKERNDAFENRINDLAGTVSDLDKLSKTDKELLQKYSKVYFLNEHYVPESLREIDDEWKYSEDKELKLHTKVIPFFEDMVENAKEDGVDLWVVSAYRSFYDQAELKGRYTVTYGSGANAFSADQGFSEHQLGTTMDLTTKGLNGGLEGFGNTEAYKWLVENAYKYGFTLSYPEDNGFYVFEPWHWRFVGVEFATYLKENDLHFYDVAQREIDQYLLHIFD